MTSNYLYVDPDGLDRISGPYEDAAQNFIRLSAYLSELRGRYANAWGNDDLGQKVSPQVQQALRTLQDQVDALGKALGVYGEGLRTTSHAYREADSNAGDAATQFRARTERIAVDMPPAVSGSEEEPRVFMRSSKPADLVAGQRVEGVPLQPRRLARRSVQPGEEADAQLEPRHYESARIAEEGVEGSQAAPLMPALRMRAERIPPQPAHFRTAEPGEPVQPAHYMPAHRVRGELMEPLLPGTPLMPAEPVQPAHYMPARRELMQPAEPVQPLTPLIPAEPVLPAHYRSVDPGTPVEPLPEA